MMEAVVGETVTEVSVGVGVALLPPHPAAVQASNESATSAFEIVLNEFLKFIESLLCVSVLALFQRTSGPSRSAENKRRIARPEITDNSYAVCVRATCTHETSAGNGAVTPRMTT
jgi:hypothetical protein